MDKHTREFLLTIWTFKLTFIAVSLCIIACDKLSLFILIWSLKLLWYFFDYIIIPFLVLRFWSCCIITLSPLFKSRFGISVEKPSGAHLSQRCLSHFEETSERRKFIGYTIDNCIGRMENPLYRERNSRIKFAKLSYYLAEHFPHEKLQELKYLLEGMSFLFRR